MSLQKQLAFIIYNTESDWFLLFAIFAILLGHASSDALESSITHAAR